MWRPGQIDVVETTPNSVEGMPTPGGGYTETTPYTATSGKWTEGSTARSPGGTVDYSETTRDSTFLCTPVHQAPPSFAPAINPSLTLGTVWASNQQGYGTVRPPVIYNGGSPSGMVQNIVWDSWGGDRAVGHGEAIYVDGNASVAESPFIPAEVLAYNPGSCGATPAYTSVQWYFPSKGVGFDASRETDIC